MTGAFPGLAAFKQPAADAPMLAWALAYATAGMAIFPVTASKKPLTPHGYKDASTDEKQIRDWWKRYPCAEIAWAIPREILVADLDEKKGQHGIRDFIAQSGLDPDELHTPRATTPSGGRHLFFRANGAVYKNIVGVNGWGIDLRTIGGLAVLPGAGNGRFWSEHKAPLAEVPSFIPTVIDRAETPGEAKEFSGETSTYAQAALEYAREAIETAPNGEQESTLNRECYSLGGLVGAGALDKEPTIAALTAAALRMPAYEKPWHGLEVKVRRTVEEGARKPRTVPGEATARDESSEGAAPLNGVAYQFRWHGEAYDGPLKEWLVEGMLPRIGKALISGQWGTYKTFVAMDLASAVMTKTVFAGRLANYQGGVLFIATEGQDEVRVRLEAVAREKIAILSEREDGVVPIDPAHLPFVWIEDCPRLTADNASKELCKIIEAASREMQTRFGLPLALVIIDTLMPAAGFKDADDAAEAQRVMSVLTKAAQSARALVVAVDHFGKDASTGTRNSSVKEDNADAVLALLGERSLAGVVSNPRLALRKIKGGQAGEEIPFQTHTVTIEGKSGFDATTSLVVDWTAENSNSPPTRRPWPKSLTIFKNALDFTLGDTGERIRPFIDGPEVLAAKRELVRAEFLKAYPADSADARGEAFRRAEKLAGSERLITARTVGPAAVTYLWPAW